MRALENPLGYLKEHICDRLRSHKGLSDVGYNGQFLPAYFILLPLTPKVMYTFIPSFLQKVHEGNYLNSRE
jgi:hypothetical protein